MRHWRKGRGLALGDNVADAAGSGVAGGAGNTAGARTGGYDAFISYSQRGDKAIAQALRAVIQTIGKPWWQVRSLSVFLDAASLSAAPGLWESIAGKLDRSRYLILLASPEAAKSVWVDREVAHFLAGAGAPRLLIGLTDGALAWDAAKGDFEVELPTELSPVFRVRDYGRGLSHADRTGIYTKLYASTKRESDQELGGWGLGRFSPFAYLLSDSPAGFFQSVWAVMARTRLSVTQLAEAAAGLEASSGMRRLFSTPPRCTLMMRPLVGSAVGGGTFRSSR